MIVVASNKSYEAPQAKIIEVIVKGVLCQSGSTINDLNTRDDDTSHWG